jgi:hypothetical protein
VTPDDTSPVIGQAGTGMGTPDATGWLKPRIHPEDMTIRGDAQASPRPGSRWRISELGFVKPLLMPGGTGIRRHRPVARAILYHYGALRGEPGGNREWAWGYDTRLHPDHGTHMPGDRSWIKGYARNQAEAKAAAERELPNHIDEVEARVDRPWAERLAQFTAHAGDRVQTGSSGAPGAIGEAIARNHPTLEAIEQDLARSRSRVARLVAEQRMTPVELQRSMRSHTLWESGIARTRATIPAMLASLRAKADAEASADRSGSGGASGQGSPALARHPVATPVPEALRSTGIKAGSVIATAGTPVKRATGEPGTR